MPVEIYLNVIIGGVLTGLVYGLMVLGLSVIFGVTRIVNFAHGALYMLGAFIAFSVGSDFGLSLCVAMLVAPILIGGFGLVLVRLFLRRLYRLDPSYNLLLTFGLTPHN